MKEEPCIEVGLLEKECRVCCCEETESGDFMLENVCNCTGSMKWIHLKCLEKELQHRYEGDNVQECTICHGSYTDIEFKTIQKTFWETFFPNKRLWIRIIFLITLSIFFFILPILYLILYPIMGAVPQLNDFYYISSLFESIIYLVVIVWKFRCTGIKYNSAIFYTTILLRFLLELFQTFHVYKFYDNYVGRKFFNLGTNFYLFYIPLICLPSRHKRQSLVTGYKVQISKTSSDS